MDEDQRRFCELMGELLQRLARLEIGEALDVLEATLLLIDD